MKDNLAQRLARLPPFHPSSTAETARVARHAGDQADRRDGTDRGDRARPGGADGRDNGARRSDLVEPADGKGDGARRDDQAELDGRHGDGARRGGRAEVDGGVGRDDVGRQDDARRNEAAWRGDRAGGRGDGEQDAALRGDQETVPEAAGDVGADQPEVSYWDKVEGFERLWEQHVERWPGPGDDDRARDWTRPGDPPGSWRGEGGRYLSPEQNAEANRLIATLRAPEPEVTTMLQTIDRDNAYGARLVGLQHRVKGDQRLKEKVVDGMANEVLADVSDAVTEISDAVRYTFRIDQHNYVQGYHDLRERLESAGYQMTYSRNHWVDDPQYNGVNTRWTTPTGGRFELQFHTEESLHAKERFTHNSYDRLRSPVTSWGERGELEAFERAVAAAVPEPIGVEEIKDHGRKSR